MLADWSSIFAGFAVVFGGLALYGVSIGWRLRAAERHCLDDGPD